MRKITSFYYLNYPDSLPSDPINAFSEVYVEIGDEQSNIERFEATYSIFIYTIGYISYMIKQSGYGFLLAHTALIVDRFDDEIIETMLEKILPCIEEYGTRVQS